jgi:hypothetical protein
MGKREEKFTHPKSSKGSDHGSHQTVFLVEGKSKFAYKQSNKQTFMPFRTILIDRIGAF